MPTSEQREYYARRASEVRRLAAAASDPDIRQTLEKMAKSYDTLVDEAFQISVLERKLSAT